MSDKFLFDARPSLNRQFAERLYREISKSHPTHHPFLSRQRLVRGLLRAVAIAGICFGIFMVSPTAARAEFMAIMNSIGKNLQTTMSRLIGRVFVIDTEPSDMDAPPEEMVRHGDDSTLVLMPAVQAFMIFPTPITVPTWAPSPCSLEDNALVDQDGAHPSITLIWACGSDANSRIFLTVQMGSMLAHFPPDSYKEITLRGEPGLVVNGMWHQSGSDFAWVADTTRILWSHNNLLYDLMAPADQFVEGELLQMAESVQ